MSWWIGLSREAMEQEVARREREQLFKDDRDDTHSYQWKSKEERAQWKRGLSLRETLGGVAA